MKRLLFLLIVLMTGLQTWAHDFEAPNSEGVTIYYNKMSSTEVEVTFRGYDYYSYSYEYEGNVEIPSTVTYSDETYSVTSIGISAFNGCNGLISVTIPDSVNSIGWYAFYGCTSVTSVIIPNSVTSIGWYSFYGCSDLLSIDIPEGVTEIGDMAFFECSKLTSVIIPDSVATIGKDAFYGTALYYDSANWEDGVLYINHHLIKAKTELAGEYIIRESTLSISDEAFRGCTEMSSITIPVTITKIGQSVFSRCTSLAVVTLPDSLTSIGFQAFSWSGLLSLKIPDSVITIGDQAFSGCGKLTSVTIGNAVTQIGTSAFESCGNLSTILIPDSVSMIRECAFQYCSGLTSVVIGNSVTSIGTNAFYDCDNLTSVIIPDSVISIGHQAFACCTDLTSVKISESLTEIASLCFNRCTSLTSVNIPSSVANIGSYAFADCWELKTITIPNTVCVIGEGAFSGSEIKTITFESATPIDTWENIYPGNDIKVYVPSEVYSTTNSKIHLINYVASSNVTEEGVRYVDLGDNRYIAVDVDGTLPATVHIKNGTKEIVSGLLANKTELKSLIFPNSITEISELPSSLLSVTAGQNVTSFGWLNTDRKYCKYFMLPNASPNPCEIFSNNPIVYTANPDYGDITMTHLSSMFEVDGIRYIPISLSEHTCMAADVIYERGRKSYTVPAKVICRGVEFSVLEVGPALFANVEAEEIIIEASAPTIPTAMCYDSPNLAKAVLPDSATEIDVDAFNNCTQLSEVNIPESVVAIADYAFYTCRSLQEVVLGNNVRSVGMYALRNCSGMQSLTLGQSLTTIGYGAFWGCSSLRKLSLLDGVAALTCRVDVFKDSPLEEVLIGRNLPGALFKDKNTLKTAWITDIVTEIPDYLFYHCSALENLYVGDGVTKISDWAFSGCYGLKLFNFGKNITEIGDNALSDCSGMVDIYAEPTVPPTVYTQGLDDINKWECTLHYPAGAPYMSADQWKEFLFADNDFMVTMPEETIAAEAGDVITVTAAVGGLVDPEKVEWRSSNPYIAEILEGTTPQLAPTRSASSSNTISVNVLVHKKEQVTIAAFLPTGQMANCIVNKGYNTTGIPEFESQEANEPVDGEYLVYNLQGILVMRTADAERIKQLAPGIYIVNGKKVLLR